MSAAVRSAVPAGLLAGLAASLLTYATVAALLFVDDSDVFQQGAWKSVGFFLYNAHFVDVTFSGPGGARSVNLLWMTEGSTAFPAGVYHVLPVVVLLVAGFLVASWTDIEDGRLASAIAGSTVATGYLLFVVLGLVLFQTTGETAASPDLAASVLVAGLAYPVVFGGIGGVVGGLRSSP